MHRRERDGLAPLSTFVAIVAAMALGAAAPARAADPVATPKKTTPLPGRTTTPSPTAKPSVTPTAPALTATALAFEVERYDPSKTGIVRSVHIAGQTFLYEDIDGIGILEGDIVLGPVSSLMQLTKGVLPRGVVVDPGVPFFGARWPNGVVPYRVKSDLDGTMKQRIDQAIAEWEAKTPIDLRPATQGDNDLVEFRAGRGCSSSVGRIGRMWLSGSEAEILTARNAAVKALEELEGRPER